MLDFIKGKSVAFVGLAPNIMGHGLGDEINSFDLVFRTNNFPIPDDYKKDYGTKCDVILMLKSSAIRHDFFADNGIKWVIHYRPVLGQIPRLGYYMMTVGRRNEIRSQIMKDIGFNPKHGTAGVNIVATCLQANAKSIKLFGVTGYQNKNGEVVNHHEQKDVKHYIPLFRIKSSVISMRRHPSHDFAVQNCWLRFLLKNGKITMDPYSLEYFQI